MVNIKYLLKVAENIKPVHWSVTIFLGLLFYNFFNNEILPLDYVQIFDEQNYIDIVNNFYFHLTKQDFTPYYNSRIIIPAIAHYIIDLLNFEPNIPTIRNIFLGFNLFSIILSLYYFYKIVKFKKYKESTIILGFCFLFVNFFILKLSNYYPVLLDIFGFTSGLIIYYYYVVNNRLAFFISLFLSLFIFPTTIFVLGSLITSTLVIFSEKGLNIEKNLNKYRLVLFAVFILSILSFFYLYILQDYYSKSTQFELEFVPITIMLLFILFFYILKPILLLFDKISLNKKFYNSPLFYLSVLLLFLFTLISKILSINYDGIEVLSPLNFIFNLFHQSLSFPLKFLISHFIYYGLFVIIFLLFHKHFFRHLKQSNTFFKIITIVFVLLSIMGTETRQFIQLFPFIVVIFLDSLDKYKFNKNFLITIFVFQLIWSRFWYNINTPDGFLVNAFPSHNFMDFPAQRYFQFQGPWLSTSNSIIYGGIFLITYLILVVLVKRMYKRGMQTY